VHYTSEFSSEDYGAFEDSLISMDEVVREGATYWAAKVPYKKGQSLEPYSERVEKRNCLFSPILM